MAPSGPCRAVGDAIELPAANAVRVVAQPDGYLVLTATNGQAESYWISHDGVVGEAVPIGLGRGIGATAIAAGALGDSVVATTFDGFWKQVGLTFRRYGDTAWEDAPELASGALPDVTLSTQGADLTISGTGTLAGVWSEGRMDKAGKALLRSAEGTYGTVEDVFDGDMVEMHGAFDGAETLHVTGPGRVPMGDALVLRYRARAADGTWAAPLVLGPTPGSLQNQIVTGIVATPNGDVFAAETHPSDFATRTDGATVVYAIDGAEVSELARLTDPRPVASGLSMAPLGDNGAVIAVAYGQNRLPPGDSEDDVRLYRCDAAGCGLGLMVVQDRGTFYGNTAVATQGQRGLVVWSQQTKQEDEEYLGLQRFDCGGG